MVEVMTIPRPARLCACGCARCCLYCSFAQRLDVDGAGLGATPPRRWVAGTWARELRVRRQRLIGVAATHPSPRRRSAWLREGVGKS